MVNQVNGNQGAFQTLREGPRQLHNLKPIKAPDEKNPDQAAKATEPTDKNTVSGLQAKLKARQPDLTEIKDIVSDKANPSRQPAKSINILA
jgi:hypothetical protein